MAAAIAMATANPAHFLGLGLRDELAPGAPADLVRVDAELNVVAIHSARLGDELPHHHHPAGQQAGRARP